MRILSPAKINLHLRIGPVAPDGFHPLLSWMCTVGLFDTIEMAESDSSRVRLACNRPDVPIDETNLILRAARAISPESGADVFLDKKIPMGGGLGGGSSNAAFSLGGFNQLWNLNRSTKELEILGARLGSDVPFFLHGPSSICEGRGERVSPIAAPAPKVAVLFFPPMSMSTPAVYRKFDQMELGRTADIQNHPDWTAWTKLPAAELLKHLVNDLEAPSFALNPVLGELRKNLERNMKRTVRMSGSGSTLFTLADHESETAELLAKIQNLNVQSAAYLLAPQLPLLRAI